MPTRCRPIRSRSRSTPPPMRAKPPACGGGGARRSPFRRLRRTGAARRPRRAGARRRAPHPPRHQRSRAGQPRPRSPSARQRRGKRDRRRRNVAAERTLPSRRRRRSNIPSCARATRASSAGSIRPISASAPIRGAARAAPSCRPDAADGHADRLALGAYRAAQCAARTAAAPRNVNPVDWVAERAWLLLRMGEADAARMLVVRGRYRPLHAEDGPGRGAERARQRRSAGALPAAGGHRRRSTRTSSAGRRDVRLAGRRAGNGRGADRRGAPARAGSAGSTWSSPRRSSAPAPTPAAR